MESVIEIIRIILPIVILGIIAVFVILRLKGKQERGTLGKKETKAAQDLLDSLIPFGIIFGSIVGLAFSFIFPITLTAAITLGSGAGMLGGYFAYEYYSKRKETNAQ